MTGIILALDVRVTDRKAARLLAALLGSGFTFLRAQQAESDWVIEDRFGPVTAAT